MKFLYSIVILLYSTLVINFSGNNNQQKKNIFQKEQEVASKTEVNTTPLKNKKALLLLPFQHQFKENVSKLERYFNQAGYKTEIYKNGNADLNKFRGSFLMEYDVVYISTHGHSSIELNKTNGKKAPQIVVGVNPNGNDREIYDTLTLEEKKTTGRVGKEPSETPQEEEEEEEKTHLPTFGLSPQWFKVTSKGKKFNNTWIFLNACHSAGVNSGQNSFASTFIELGAAGFNGYSDYIILPLSNAISEAAIAIFTSGKSFNKTTQKIKSSIRLKFIERRIKMNARESRKKYANINLFVSRKGKSSDFYLK